MSLQRTDRLGRVKGRKSHSRLRFSCAFAFFALSYPAVGSAASQGDLVFLNGAVYTVDAARSWAAAVVVTADRITYVGDDATAKSFVGPGTRVIDLGQRMLLPGFQDSHVHPSLVPNPATTVLLDGLTRREQVLDRIRRFARVHPEKAWIVGSLWDEVAFLPSGQPTREMLDAVVPDRPAYLDDNSGHEGWANSRASAAAHITSATPNPLNGRIERDAKGRPTGALQEESAMDLVRSVIPPPSPDERAMNLSAALQEMSRLGFTAIEDAYVTPESARAYRALDKDGKLDLRTNLCLVFVPSQKDDAQIEYFLRQRAALVGRRLRATCVKILLDGAYGSHTLVLLQPYSDDPNKYGSGKLFLDQERLNRLVARLDAEGFQIHMHTQGDGAVHAALEAFAEARRENRFRDNRHTLAHLCLIDAADIARFRNLRVVANMTPLWSLGDAWETVFAPRLFGRMRSEHIFKTRTLLDSGVIVVWGSDWPVTGVSPLDGLETAVTHRYPGGKDLNGKEDETWNPEERVTLEQAITAYTAAGAYLMHDDSNRGSLVAGKAADLVVLSRNVFAIAPLDIHNVQVDMTVLDGKVVFARTPD
jgi:predicted amidohydrolase YtcJ